MASVAEPKRSFFCEKDQVESRDLERFNKYCSRFEW